MAKFIHPGKIDTVTYVVMAGGVCYGTGDSYEDAAKIVRMRKMSRNGRPDVGDTMASKLNWSIEKVDNDE